MDILAKTIVIMTQTNLQQSVRKRCNPNGGFYKSELRNSSYLNLIKFIAENP